MAAPLSNAAKIRIAEDLRLHPLRTESSFRATARPAAQQVGGIYNARSFSRSSADRRLSFARGAHEHRAEAHSVGGAEEGDEWQPGDIKQKQVFRGTTLLWYVACVDPCRPCWIP